MSSLDSLVQAAQNAMPATTTAYGVTSMEQFAPAPKEGFDVLGFNIPTWLAAAAGIAAVAGGGYMLYRSGVKKGLVRHATGAADTYQATELSGEVGLLLQAYGTLDGRKNEVESSYLPNLFFPDYDDVCKSHATLRAKLAEIKGKAERGEFGKNSDAVHAMVKQF